MAQKNKYLSKKEKDLVIARLEILSPKLHFSSGESSKSFSRDEMIAQIESGTKIGKEFVETELKFLRAIKDGILLKRLTTK